MIEDSIIIWFKLIYITGKTPKGRARKWARGLPGGVQLGCISHDCFQNNVWVYQKHKWWMGDEWILLATKFEGFFSTDRRELIHDVFVCSARFATARHCYHVASELEELNPKRMMSISNKVQSKEARQPIHKGLGKRRYYRLQMLRLQYIFTSNLFTTKLKTSGWVCYHF